MTIGVHTPEFSFEHHPDRVRQAIDDHRIEYPVVIDNDFAVWNAFDNHYWPALYFVDREGVIRDHHVGEGRYEKSEHVIQRLIGVRRDLVPIDAVGIEVEADWNHLLSPETYLGYASTPVPIRFQVLLDGQPPGASHGSDVDEHGDGLLDNGRLYQLVRQHGDVAERTVEVTFFEPGAEAYAFTFG